MIDFAKSARVLTQPQKLVVALTAALLVTITAVTLRREIYDPAAFETPSRLMGLYLGRFTTAGFIPLLLAAFLLSVRYQRSGRWWVAGLLGVASFFVLGLFASIPFVGIGNGASHYAYWAAALVVQYLIFFVVLRTGLGLKAVNHQAAPNA